MIAVGRSMIARVPSTITAPVIALVAAPGKPDLVTVANAGAKRCNKPSTGILPYPKELVSTPAMREGFPLNGAILETIIETDCTWVDLDAGSVWGFQRF